MRCLLAVLTFFALPLAATADEKIKTLFKKCAPATVYIENKPNEDGSYSLGSGSIIDAAGVIVTNHHVIEPCLKGDREVKVFLFDGRQFVGEVFGETKALDLALVRLKDSPGGLPVIEWADSDAIEVGEDVIAIGNPDGLKWTISQGIVSGKRQDMIQTTAALNPGNSGGPLIGPDGKQVGVNTLSAYADRNNIAFARTSNVARQWIEQVTAGDVDSAVTARYNDPEYGFSCTPPQGWRLLDDNDKVQFQRVAWEGDDSAFRVFFVEGEGKRGVRKHSADQEAALKKDLKKYKRLKLDFYDFRGKEDAYGLIYRFDWEGAGYSSYQVTVNDNGNAWTLRFTTPEAKYNALVPKMDETIQSAKWTSDAGGAQFVSPERVLETWVQSIRNSDAELFLACFDVPAYLDSLTSGAWTKANAAGRKEMEAKFRKNVEDMIKAGTLAKQVEKGVRILAATVEGDTATVGVISVSDTGQTVIEEARLAKRGERWYLTGFGESRVYEEGGKTDPGPTREVKRKTYKDAAKSFSVSHPANWSTGAQEFEGGIVVHSFSEKEAASNPSTHTIVGVADLRKDLKQDKLTEEELDTLTENVLSGVKGQFKEKFTVKSKRKSKLGGLDALEVHYFGRASEMAPEYECRLWVAYRNGWAYMATVMHKAGDEISPEYRKIVDSFKATGKR